jgi:hypothetical protein
MIDQVAVGGLGGSGRWSRYAVTKTKRKSLPDFLIILSFNVLFSITILFLNRCK